MIHIVIKVARAAATEVAKFVAVSGGITAAMNFLTRRMKKVKLSPQSEFQHMAADFGRGASSVFRSIPVTGIVVLSAAVAGAAVVSETVAAAVLVAGLAVFAVAGCVYGITKLVRRGRKSTLQQPAIKVTTTKIVEQNVTPIKPIKVTESVDATVNAQADEIVSLDIQLDETIFTKTNREIRTAGAEWTKKNIDVMKVQLKQLKGELKKALATIQTSGTKRVMFMQGVEDAYTA